MKGDAEPLKELYSRRDDVSLANPYGPPVRGWKDVAATMERAAKNYKEGEAADFDRISDYATADMAYVVDVERYRSKIAGAEDLASFTLRVTTIFRLEDDEWRIVHRHADPITAPQSPDSVVQR